MEVEKSLPFALLQNVIRWDLLAQLRFIGEMVTTDRPNSLYNLVYVSVASRPFEESELLELLEDFRANNSKFGITGMLLFRDGAFMQALEGPKDRVRRLFDNIQRDKRHECVVVLYEGPLDSRFFPDWSMGFKSPSEREMAKVEGYTSFLNYARQPCDLEVLSSVARRLLDSFRRTTK